MHEQVMHVNRIIIITIIMGSWADVCSSELFEVEKLNIFIQARFSHFYFEIIKINLLMSRGVRAKETLVPL